MVEASIPYDPNMMPAEATALTSASRTIKKATASLIRKSLITIAKAKQIADYTSAP
jgi:hypothetical protein